MNVATIKRQVNEAASDARNNIAPFPLAKRQQAPAYPVDALGTILGEAAKSLAYYVQVPIGMAGQSVLAAAALVAQGHINVRRGTIGSGPVSLFCVTVAGSGERKTALDKLALSPIRQWEADRREEMEEKLAAYRSDKEAWDLRRESVITAAKPKKKGEAMSAEQQRQLSDELLVLDGEKPQPPPRPNITFEEPTPEGMYRHYLEGLPIVGLFSDEGLGFIGGHGMSDEAKGRTITAFSQLWDGSPLTRTRGTVGESGILAGRRLSAHLMMQPIVAAKVLSDPLLLGQGFLARFLICQEESLAGTRFLAKRDLSKGPEHDPAIGHYYQRLTDMLNAPLDIAPKTGELRNMATAEIEGQAFTDWCQIHDAIESQLGSEGEYADIQAFASKAAENTARIAAVLAYVEGYQHPQTEHIERSGWLMAYYLESMKVRTNDAQLDQQELQASDLLEWIRSRAGEVEATEFKRLPNAYRNAKKARTLLAFLVAAGHLVISDKNQHGKPCAWRVSEVSHD